jgi:adenylate cyclase
MRQALPAINARWQARLGDVTDISIGIHSGTAQVGNIGSRRKYKYGALGTTVNLASRLQGATKYVGPSVLASIATIQLADRTLASRRICTIQTVNIDQPMTVFELCASPRPGWEELKSAYERALQCFEQQEFATAQTALQVLLNTFPDDIPAQRLLDRLSKALHREAAFDPVWKLEGK